MPDIQKQIAEATAKAAALHAERTQIDATLLTLEREAKALEQQARDKWAERAREKERRGEISKAIGELDALLRHSQVVRDVETAAAETFKAKTEADATLERLNAKEKQLDELLAKHQQPPADPPDA